MDKFLKGIEKTGFGLEYLISKSLMEEDWTVINNKYYIDDVQGSAREIDILAYKVGIKNDIQVYTVLIISCKKSQENTWALLAKDKNNYDPNIDWNPVTLWSNEKRLKLMIENYDWKNDYINSSGELKNKLFTPDKHIFAFQELNQKSGKPQNDKAIFNSIVSSMKSQNYEIGSLNVRKKQDSLYNFNLISVVDAPLIQIYYSGSNPTAKPIDSDIYVGSYIINKKETISRVHFVTADFFTSCLPIYDKLHLHNIEQLNIIESSYFNDCLKDKKKRDLFEKQFNRETYFDVYIALREIKENVSIQGISLSLFWSERENRVGITINSIYDDEVINMLSNNVKIKAIIKSKLAEIYHYRGEFYFETEIPF